MPTVSDLLVGALTEIRVARAGDTPSPDDMATMLFLFNEYLDALNADSRAIYTVGFETFTLTPALQPHTIGLVANTPTFAVSVGRPSRILNANLILADNIRVPFRRLNGARGILDDAEWNAILAGAAAGQTPTITSAVPTHLYYSPEWPNGSIFLWPVPTTAYGLELETETLLAQMALDDDLSLPPGYQQMLRLTLAELAAPSFGQAVGPRTAQVAAEARARVWANNAEIPNAATRDAGMPGGSGGGYDYRTGMNA